ncbi:MAG TPA: selenocysteine-specific translation elongation factor, partial [Firmicutes bacterium]|nr:selenocysteine-specific translation elongation factor [Bacillota bacterium]
MTHVIIGTAGHVDHGKTMLIKALTGEDTDRLKEEKERGLSIDLGFAPFDLPGGRRAGVVDVPGHEKFINNMLAGSGGIDLVLLVVDVTEGVMPQTREHLAILDLLAIKKGIIVLTKIDLVEPAQVDLAEEEVYRELKGTFLAAAPCRRVSARTGAGIEELKALIDRETASIAARNADAPLRMPVDRVFSLAGFGTIVTGTIIAGRVENGAEVEVLPAGRKTRIRRIQVHGAEVEEAFAGQRAALNLAHLVKHEAARGSVVVSPGFYQPTTLLDVRLRLLPGASQPLKNMAPLHLHLGTARTVARALLLDKREIKPGGEGLVQLKLERQLVAQNSDRFIVRSFSPVTTIGGGVVLDHLPLRHKPFQLEVIENLKGLEEGDAAGYLMSRIKESPLITGKELAPLVRLSPERMRELLDAAIKEGKAVDLGGHLALKEKYEAWVKELSNKIAEFHRLNNLAPGISRASLKRVL